MTNWELIVCFQNRTWNTYFVEHPDHIQESDVHQAFIEDYDKKSTDTSPVISYVGTYNTESID